MYANKHICIEKTLIFCYHGNCIKFWKGSWKLKTSDFYFDLPEELIAQVPIKDRSSSKLMVLDKKTGEIEHKIYTKKCITPQGYEVKLGRSPKSKNLEEAEECDLQSILNKINKTYSRWLLAKYLLK